MSEYLERVKSIQGARRRIALTSDIIVGFPGETEASSKTHFVDGGLPIRRSLHLQIFGTRGTPAARLPDTVSEGEEDEALPLPRTIQMRIRMRFSRTTWGEVFVLAERESAKSKADLTGHTTCHKVVNFRAGPELIGEIVRVRVTQAKAHSLYGELAA